MKKISSINKVVFLLIGLCISFSICGQISMSINNGLYNISYDLNSSCDLLASSAVPKDLKCLMLCQMTTCKSLQFNASSNSCILVGSNPSLIKYETFAGINLTYILGNILFLTTQFKSIRLNFI